MCAVPGRAYPSLTAYTYNCIAVIMGSLKKAKSARRLQSQRVLRGIGLSPHSAGAQLRVGDVRDAKRVEYLLKTFKDTTKIPEFLTVPISDWCATPSIRACGFHQVFRSSYPIAFFARQATPRVSRGSAARPALPPADRRILRRITRNEENRYAAENDPFKALDTLRAIRKRVPGVSDRSLLIIWLLRQPDVCEEIRALSELDDNDALRYDAFRGADSLEASASVFLPDGFLNFEDFSDGGIYASAFAAECGDDNGVVEPALCAVEKKSKAEQSKRTQATDAIFNKAVPKGVKEKRKPVAVLPYAGIVGGEGRDHATRYEEKVRSDQLFGRVGRELVRAAGGDIESMSEDDIVAAAKTKLAVHNRVFMSRQLFIALAMVGGEAYRRGGKGITAIEQDVEGIAGALIGGMIKTGGLNVDELGCEAERVSGLYTDARFAFGFMRDVAFAKAVGGDADAFEAEYESVKTTLAKDVFLPDQRLMQRLAATSVLLKEVGLKALAKADAKALARRERPTYDTIDAGTFSRALAAECGRKGGSASAKLVRDFFDPKVKQSKENKRKAKKIIFSGIPAGKMTGDAKRAHMEAAEAGGGTPAGAMTGDAKRAHMEACEAGGAPPAGARLSDKDVLHQMIGRFIKKEKDGSPIAVSRLTVRTDSENTYTFYASRDASLKDYKAFYLSDVTPERHRELYDIVCTSGAKVTNFVLPLSNDSRCEGVAIGGSWSFRRGRGAWRGWSLAAYSNLKKKGVTWSVEDVLITDDMVRAFELEMAANKATRSAKKAEREKKRKRLAPSAPGPGVGKRRTT